MYEVRLLETMKLAEDYFTSTPERVLGTIEVKPPIIVGEKFSSAILGQDQNGVRIHTVGSTQEATILLAEAGIYNASEEHRQEMLDEITKRVVAFVEQPETALSMMQENPFPNPSEW